MADPTHPIEGQTVLLAGAQASVTLERLSALLERAHDHLGPRRSDLVRRFERVDVNGRSYVLADEDYWDTVGTALELTDREADALRRAHGAQFRRDGRRADRRAEFETAMEIRDPVAVGATADPIR